MGLLLRCATGLGADPAAVGGGLPPPQRRHLLRRRREAQGAVEPRVHSRSKPELNVAGTIRMLFILTFYLKKI